MKNLFILLFTISSFSNYAQTKSIKNSPKLIEATPASAGMSDERLARIDNMLNKAVADSEIPGAVALIARHGKIVYLKAFGMADNASSKKLNTDAIFRIASQTKAITTTAVMMLWEEGKFKLDDPISKYIPEFKNPQVLDSVYPDGKYTTKAAKREITIRDLITHTSGIGYGQIDSNARFKKIYKDAGVTDLFTTDKITIGESVKKLAKLPLHHNPGEKFTYSEGLDVIGYFIELMSGMPMDEYYRTHIFEPLGMNDTYFYLPQSKANRLVTIQTKENDKWISFPNTFYDVNYPIKGAKSFFSGGAGLSSTVKDYATFLQMFLNKGELNGVRLLSRTTIQFMLSNQIGEIWGKTDAGHGLGFRILNQMGEDLGGQGSTGTFNWGGYFNTQYFADPKEDLIGIILKQTQKTSDNTGWKFQLLAEQAIDD
ncbi:serine hydrolase domain-containing protein [Flavobacterium daejeonense]|uniref:serine hydrolase domain-containing protein n=1 Tax=Flavobacterium daejeonense TaxID=350893 RepID=UPI00047DD3B0|nr:serine hydrolase domain-containing protein [Flavobacterium daejeonense]